MKSKVKGFTLIELIIVMAIFSVIMFGAISLMDPSNRMMVSSEIQENGNAAVSGISQYVRNQIAPCENIIVYDGLPRMGDGVSVNQATVSAKVAEFVNAYYPGFIKGNSDPNHPLYGDGTFHVMLIDNRRNGLISTMTYTAKFGVDDSTTKGAQNVTQTEYKVNAVNRAYYDSYAFTFRLGNLDEVSDFTSATSTFANAADALSAQNTVISILAHTTRNGLDYDFIEHCSLSMVNIANRRRNYPSSMYYTVGTVQERDADGHDIPGPSHAIPGILDVSNSASGYTATVPVQYHHDSNLDDGYMIIYCYGDEINT